VVDLHDLAWQFIITTSITIISCVVTSIITIWLARRIPVELPVSYETLNIEEIQGEENIKAIKAKMQMLLDEKPSDSSCLFAFKIWNDGKKPIRLSDSTPLIIRFKQGVKILGWDNLECEPDYIKVIPTIEEREVRLDLPFLDSKHSITMHLLLSDYVNYFPDIYSEVHHSGRNKFVKANNIRSSRENRIAGIIAICIGVYSLISYYSSSNVSISKLSNVPLILLGYIIIGIGFLYTSYVERSITPHHKLLSRIVEDKIKEILPVLPYVIVITGIGIAIYSFFGKRAFVACMFTLITFLLPAGLWYEMYYVLKWLFKKLKINCKLVFIIIMTSIIPIAIFLYMLPVCISFWTYP